MNLPTPVGTLEGRSTSVTELRACADVLGRPLVHLAQFIAWQVRSEVAVYPDNVVVYAQLAPSAPQQLVASYIETCVRCKACKALARGLVGVCAQCSAQDPDPVPPETASMVIEIIE